MVNLNSKRFLLISVLLLFVLFAALVVSVIKMVGPQESMDSGVMTNEEEVLDAEMLLSPPLDTGITDAEYITAVTSAAELSDTLIIGADCSVEPLVIEMTGGSVLRVKNQDSVERVVAFEDQNFFAVSAGETREIDVGDIFGKESGIYRYRCGDIPESKNTGVMYITAQ